MTTTVAPASRITAAKKTPPLIAPGGQPHRLQPLDERKCAA